jgi:DNA-binding CsgD family transcriptional regulator
VHFVEEIKSNITERITEYAIPCVTFVFDYKNMKYCYVSPLMAEMTGYNAEEYYCRGVELHLSRMHPDDMKLFTNEVIKNIISRTQTFRSDQLSKYRFSITYRYLRSDGKYIHILQQHSVLCRDERKNPLVIAGFLTDISFLKRDDCVSLQIAKYNRSKNCFQNIDIDIEHDNNSKLTISEKKILNLILKGKKNDEIARELSNSIFTIKAHRRNILKKLEAKNFMEVAQKMK